MPPVSDYLLTIPEAAERLKLSRAYIFELIRDGKLGSVRVGRARRVPDSAVQAFIAERTEPCGDAS